VVHVMHAVQVGGAARQTKSAVVLGNSRI
jgi:hypothetical protein